MIHSIAYSYGLQVDFKGLWFKDPLIPRTKADTSVTEAAFIYESQ